MALKKVAYAPFAYLVDRVSEQKVVGDQLTLISSKFVVEKPNLRLRRD